MGRMVEVKDRPGVLRPEATDYFVFTASDLVRRLEVLREAFKGAGPEEKKRITEEAAAAKAELEAAQTVVREAFGEKPRVLVVQFPSDDVAAVFPHWLKLWGGKGLICKGDGERVAWRQDGVDGPVDRDGCLLCAGPRECGLSLERGPKDKKTGKASPGCGPQGSLRFSLDVLPGIFSLEIGSWRNCRRVLSGLNGLIGSVGGLRGYPVRVSLHPERDEADGRPVTVQVVDLVPAVATGVAREMWRAANHGAHGAHGREELPRAAEDAVGEEPEGAPVEAGPDGEPVAPGSEEAEWLQGLPHSGEGTEF